MECLWKEWTDSNLPCGTIVSPLGTQPTQFTDGKTEAQRLNGFPKSMWLISWVLVCSLPHLPCCPTRFWSLCQVLCFFVVVCCCFYYCSGIWYNCVLCPWMDVMVLWFQKQFFLWAVTFICIYKLCAAKALNRSIVWHTHTLLYPK